MHRKLAAIMFTDIVGYTALMGTNEKQAFENLEKNRLLQRPVIEEFNGKWIKELGDGVMASFDTISDAVNAALKIQRLCTLQRSFQLRIGIHSGEVVFQNNDVFGDGVNIASRIQAIANPGSVYISDTIYKSISNKDFIIRFIKEEQLKNVKEPVKVYEVVTDAHEQISDQFPELIPNRLENSIAVLPFINLSNDTEQEYFSDGITEEIITDLGHVQQMLVISRSSVMTYKNTNKKIPQIASELGVQYILEGSVRKSNDQIRITAQLVDAKKDIQLWADKFTGRYEDIFDIQEKVSRSIVDSLQLKLSRSESLHLSERPIENITAFEYYLKARKELVKWNKDSIDKAKKYVEQALQITGPNPLLFATLAYTYWSYANQGFNQSENYLLAKNYIDKTLALEHKSPVAHLVLGNMEWTYYGNILNSFIHYKTVLQTNQNDFDATMWLCVCYCVTGNILKARTLADKLIRIDPLNPVSILTPAVVNFYAGDFSTGALLTKSVYKRDPENVFFKLNMVLLMTYNREFEEVCQFIEAHVHSNSEDIVMQLTYMFKASYKGDIIELKNWLNNYAVHEIASRDCQYAQIVSVICALGKLKNETLEWLGKAIEHGFINYPFLSQKDHILLEFLQGDQAYDELLKRAKNLFETFDENRSLDT